MNVNAVSVIIINKRVIMYVSSFACLVVFICYATLKTVPHARFIAISHVSCVRVSNGLDLGKSCIHLRLPLFSLFHRLCLLPCQLLIST